MIIRIRIIGKKKEKESTLNNSKPKISKTPIKLCDFSVGLMESLMYPTIQSNKRE